MGSDRARTSYDAEQQYTSVVMQQGRVTLEADWNEAQQINSEAIRSEALDFVGPCGTPDDGYGVAFPPASPSSPYDFEVDAGTMYVGGMRASLGDAVPYSNQPDWRDTGAEDPDWVDPAALTAAPPVNEFVYLFMREQEVSAVEDPALRDIALGGPDTAQRGRLLQRIVRIASPGTDCSSGLAAAQARWQTEGLSFDPQTMRLMSSGKLSVSAVDQPATPNPCQPAAEGGYLDPENQLIRVQISGVDAQTGNPKFLWGFDDASFLYRIDVDPNNPQNLILESAPVDSYHQPVRGQTVEVLRVAAELSNGGLAAALSGFPFTLDQNYNSDTQSVVVPSGVTLPADYLTPTPPLAPLFLRVWEEEKVFTVGTATALGDTGLQVTLTTGNGAAFHAGDYWMFAARPATPQAVYPQRYWNNPQPPEGPRLWACPLAVISWNQLVGVVASDCRNQFDNLVDLTRRQSGCCTVTVRPRDLSGNRSLQSIVDRLANPAMTITAIVGGFAGNNISVEISNIRSELNPATFDLAVTDSVTFFGMTVNEVDLTIGDENSDSPFPAHVVQASVSAQGLVPANSQIVTFSDARFSSARADIVDANQNVVFTLEARKQGDDGNLTMASISNLDTTANTFDLTLWWSKTLPGLTVANCIQSINAGLAYDVSASAPAGRMPSLPVEGVTALSGGNSDGQATVINASANLFGNPSTLCLSPGVYNLAASLQLTSAHSNITIESCSGAATLAAIPGQEGNFPQGLVSIADAGNVTLRGLTFRLPPPQFFASTDKLKSSIGLRPIDCQSLTVENCIFLYPQMRFVDQLHAAIYAGGDMLGFELRGNHFNGPPNAWETADSGIGASFELCGYIQSASGPGGSQAGSTITGTVVPSTLDNANFHANTFQNLLVPVVVTAAVGRLRFDANSVANCTYGVLLLLVANPATQEAFAGNSDQGIANLPGSGSGRDVLHRLIQATASYPLPDNYRPRRFAPVTPRGANEDAAQPSGVRPRATAADDMLLAPPPLSLSFSNNDIDTIVTLVNNLSPVKSRTFGGLAIEIDVQSPTPDSMLLMTGNKLRNQSPALPTVVISGVSRCVVSGNLILNEASESTINAAGAVVSPPSLSMSNIPPVQTVLYGKPATAFAVAVTGNVFRGQPTLPARETIVPNVSAPLTPPMDHWEAYNTEI